LQRYEAQQEQDRQQWREREQQEAIARRVTQAKAVKVFNDALNLPFAWTVDHKVVMSGLLADSTGDGCYQRTVWHVRVLEDFADGRFKRSAGDFLCGKDNSAHTGYTTPSEEDRNTYQVSCAQCLKVAKRFQ
jgi:hypothetical protein